MAKAESIVKIGDFSNIFKMGWSCPLSKVEALAVIMSSMPEFHLRPATPEDCGVILSLIRELAEYEKLMDQVEATEEKLEATLFGSRPEAEVWLAIHEGAVVGYSLSFNSYSTFLAKSCMYLEDIYVQPQHRGKGIGKALLRNVARVAVEAGMERLDWSVLDWNEPSIAFYKQMGAVPMDEWTTMRVTGQALLALGNSEPPLLSEGEEVGGEGRVEAFLPESTGELNRAEPVLETERLILRPLRMQDADSIEALISDWDVVKNLLVVPHPYPKGDAALFIQRKLKNTDPQSPTWGVTLKSDGTYIGQIGVVRHETFPRAEFGYWFGKPYWGNGYATEAVTAAVKSLFEDPTLMRLQAGVFSHNSSSQNVLRKIGFTHEGVRKAYYKVWGELVDSCSFALTRDELKKANLK